MSTERIDAYAAALLEIAEAEGKLAAVEDELFRAARAVETNESLRNTLGDGTIPAARRAQVVEQLLAGKASDLSVQLLSLIVGAGRTRELPQIVDALVKRSSGARQLEVAEVRSAVALSDAQQAKLADALARATGKKLNVKVVVDPTVIGGLVATIGDEVIDDTIRTRLDNVKSRL